MNTNAPFKAAESGISAAKTYRPLPIPPRAEIVAWIFSAILVLMSGLLIERMGSLPFWASLFTILTLLLALSIRFSRWLEANTKIVVDAHAIRYLSPIQKQEYDWDQIQEMSVNPSGNGWRVFVVGENGGFRFQTETTLQGMRGTRVRTGYPEGVEIVGWILNHSDLAEARVDGTGWEWTKQ